MQQMKKILNNQISSWIRFHFYFDVLIILFSEAFHYVNFEMFDAATFMPDNVSLILYKIISELQI